MLCTLLQCRALGLLVIDRQDGSASKHAPLCGMHQCRVHTQHQVGKGSNVHVVPQHKAIKSLSGVHPSPRPGPISGGPWLLRLPHTCNSTAIAVSEMCAANHHSCLTQILRVMCKLQRPRRCWALLASSGRSSPRQPHSAVLQCDMAAHCAGATKLARARTHLLYCSNSCLFAPAGNSTHCTLQALSWPGCKAATSTP